MATIKAYTDIEQSKRLAEILPPESADMYYEPSPGFCTEPSEVRFGDIEYAHPRSIRCWSFAALLNILPDRTCVYKKTYKNGLVKYQGVMEGNKELLLKDNPVDACVEMIIRLHEQNLL